MALTNFIPRQTLVTAEWLNRVDQFVEGGLTPDAQDVTNTPAGTISATNVQAAINELDTEKASLAALAASTGSALVGHIASGTGAVAQTVQDVLRDIVSSAPSRGGDPTGAADFAPILTSAFAVTNELNLPPGSYRIGTDVTVAKGKRVTLQRGAYFTVDSGKTLTIRATIDADPADWIFRGAGSVAGLTFATPHWFGAVADYSGGTGTDDGPAFNRCFTSLDQSATNLFGRPGLQVDILSGLYYIATGITAYAQWNNRLKINGAGPLIGGSRLFSAVNGPCFTVRSGNDNSPAGAAAVDLEVADFAILRATAKTGSDYGLQIGYTGEQIIGVQYNEVRNVYVDGFSVNVVQINARNIRYVRCGFWCSADNTTNFYGSAEAGKFNGDTIFDACNLVYPITAFGTTCNVRIVSAASGTTETRGWSFNSCDIYRGANSFWLTAGAGSAAGDISFNDTQFDGVVGSAANIAIRLSAEAGATIDGVGAVNSYCAGAARLLQIEGAGTVKGVQLSCMRAWYITNIAVLLDAAVMKNITMSQVNFKQIGAGTAIVGAIVISASKALTGLKVALCDLDNPSASEKCDRLIYADSGGTHANWVLLGNTGDWLIGEFGSASGITQLMQFSAGTILDNAIPTASAGLASGSLWRDGADSNRVKSVP